ncbi:MAG TPA: amidohydrolase family protein [Dehalococcoidia bacterium]|nr:amidohydrolase family protein [Dehalococcoidia bacterium]
MKDGYFICASEVHLMPHRTDLEYFPRVGPWHEAVQRYLKWIVHPDCTPEDLPKSWNAEDLIRDMDRAGVDVGFALRECMMDAHGYSSPMSTNGWVAEQAAKYPNRLLLEANVGPILFRGVKHAIWELNYWVKERDCRLVKVYQPEDSGPINDPGLWPFYEAVQELGVTLTVHTGMAAVAPNKFKYAHPVQLDDVLTDFPDLKVIAYHMGWPYTDELTFLAAKFPNLYMGMSGMVGWWTNAPYRGYHAIGMAVQMCGVEKLVFVGEWPPVDLPRVVDWIINLDMPDQLCEQWGYRKLTRKDKQLMLGETLAKLTRIEMTPRIHV